MATLIFGLVILALVLYALNAFTKVNPQTAAVVLKTGGGLGALAIALLAPCRPAGAQGYAPDEAAKKMTVADGFAVRLVAAEPMVRQPVAIEFDERGRLWVIQYLQYPNPAGLKRVAVDRGSTVKEGQVLVILEAPEMQAQIV